VNVATVLALLNEAVPATLTPAEVLSVNVAEEGVTGWLKVALGVAETATPVAPETGVVLVTAGT
jgi:hypothetical protein